MSGKRKTLSRYKKNKNDTTRKKRTKRSDSRFKRSSNKAIHKQIGGTRGSISDNPGRIDEILDYLYMGDGERGGQYYADKLRKSLGPVDHMKFYRDEIYISYSDIGDKLTSILMPWYHNTYGIFLGTIDELKEIGLIVDALLSRMRSVKITIDGFPYVDRRDLLTKLRSDPSSRSLQDAEAGGDTEEADTPDKSKAYAGRSSVLSKEDRQPNLYHLGIAHLKNDSGGKYISFVVPRSSGYTPYEYILYLDPKQTIEQFVRGLDLILGNVKELLLVNPNRGTSTPESESSSNSIDKFLKGEIVDENDIKGIPEVKELRWGGNDKLQAIIGELTDQSFIIVIKDHVRESIYESYELETGPRSKSELSLDSESDSESDSGSESESEGVSGYLVLNKPESSYGEDTGWGTDATDDDIQQFTLLVSMCDLRTGEKTDPLKLYNKIKEDNRAISISEITEKMIIDHSKILGSKGDYAESDVERNIPGIIDKLKERTDNDEHGNLYRKLKIFHELLDKNPDLIDSLLETYENYISGEDVTELERVEYNTIITVLKFLKSYLDAPPTPNDRLMYQIFLDDYRYVFLMN